jgi:hypothetical protein
MGVLGWAEGRVASRSFHKHRTSPFYRKVSVWRTEPHRQTEWVHVCMKSNLREKSSLELVWLRLRWVPSPAQGTFWDSWPNLELFQLIKSASKQTTLWLLSASGWHNVMYKTACSGWLKNTHYVRPVQKTRKITVWVRRTRPLGKYFFFSFLNKQLKDLGKTSHYKNIKLSQVW